MMMKSLLQLALPAFFILALVLLLGDDDYRWYGLKQHSSCCFVSAWTATVTRSRTSCSHIHRVIKLSSLSKRRTISSFTFLTPMPVVQDEQQRFLQATTSSSNEEYDYSFESDDDDDDDTKEEEKTKDSSSSPTPPDDDDVFAFDSLITFDGYVLDPDLYNQSRKLLNADGSLRLESLSSMSSRDNHVKFNDIDSEMISKNDDDAAPYNFDNTADDGNDVLDNESWGNPEDTFLQSTLLGTIPINDVAYRQMVEILVQQHQQPQQQGKSRGFDDSNSNNSDDDDDGDDDVTMNDLWEAIRKQKQAMEAAPATSTSLFASSIKKNEVAAVSSSNDSSAENSSNDVDDKVVADNDSDPITPARRGSDDVLHDEIFAKEEAFFLQSQTFREALIGNDREKAAKARSLRTGKAFRQRQESAIQSLQEQMDDFEQNILPQLSSSSSSSLFFSRHQVASSAFNNKTASKRANAGASNFPVVRCCQCDCLLAKDEIDHWIRQRRRFQQQKLRQKSITGDSGVDDIKRICRACHCDALVSKSNRRFAGGGGGTYRSSCSSSSSSSSKFGAGRRSTIGYPARRTMEAPKTSSMLQNALWRRQAQQQQKFPPSDRPPAN